MDDYWNILKTYLAEKKPDYGSTDIHSLIEMLYENYTSHNPIDNQAIRDKFEEMDNILEKLSWDDNNNVFSLASTLCLEHEQVAFMEGFRLGARLVVEITESIK